MDILSLAGQNFQSIGRSFNIDLANQGLVLIQGVNEDDTSAGSNGAGKSTFPDALGWCLFDETARGESGDAIINDKIGKDCFVKVVLKDGDVTYDVTRYRKHKEFKNQTVVNVWEDADGYKLTNVSKGTEKETQELINSIVGCSHDVFMAAIYAGQEATPDLPRMTDKQLKLLIEEAAGVERLEDAYELARKDALGYQNQINACAITKANVTTNAELLLSKLATAQAQHDLFESSRQARSDAQKDTAVTLVTETKLLVSTLANKSAEGLKTRLAELQTQVGGIKAKQDIVKEIESDFNNKSSGIKNQEFILGQAVKEALKFKNAYENAEVEMSEPCNACGKPHDPSEINDFKAHQKGHLAVATENVNRLNELIGVLKTELSVVVKQLSDAKSSLDLLNPQALFDETNQINAELAEISRLENDIARKKVEIQNYVDKSKAVMCEPNPELRVVEHINESIKTNQAQIDAADGAIAELEKEAEVANAVVKVFSPAGVRAHILDTVTPFLNDRTSDYLSALSDGNIHAIWTTITTTTKGDLREKFNIEVSNDKGGKSFKSLSGGEKRKVRLATMLALQDLVASRASKPINLWIGDEIDHALDEAGLERLMGILDRKARERGTVLVISHNSLSDWVDNVITVTKRDGVSTIEGSLCH